MPEKYLTVVEPVLEVSVQMVAQAAPWLALLRANDVPVLPTTDTVDLIISGVEGRYWGVMFRELSISVMMGQGVGYLAHAYNSVRAFAWSERRFFRTPYYYASQIDVHQDALVVTQDDRVLFQATKPMGLPEIYEKNEADIVKIYLPRDLRKSDDIGHYFSARLEGLAQYYDTAYAQVSVFDASGIAALDCLSQSQPKISAWSVRKQAKHSKSATRQMST